MSMFGFANIKEIFAYKQYGKMKLHIDEIFVCALIAMIAILAITRCFFGIEITDEAYYVAEGYATFQGNLPYAYNTSITAGASFVTFPFVLLFRLFNQNNDGIFLYMRICYALWRFIIIGVIYNILRSKYSRRILLPACTILVADLGLSLNFSYNTSPYWMILLSCVILATSYDQSEQKNRVLIFIAGILSALSVFAHPLHAATVIMMCALLLFLSKENRLTNFVLYVLGGVTQILISLIPIATRAGIRGLFIGLDVTLFHRLKFTSVDIIKRFTDFFQWMTPIYIALVLVFIVAMFIFWIILKSYNINGNWKYNWLCSATIALAPVSIYYGRSGAVDVLPVFGALSFWMMIMVLPVTIEPWAHFIIIPYFVFFIMEVVFPATGSARGRAYLLMPILFVTIVLLLGFLKKNEKVVANVTTKPIMVFVGAYAILISTLTIRSEYLFVYRDDSISELNTMMTEGIYKGVYTSEERGLCTNAIENFIKDNTKEGELISFRDNVPFGYLMSNGKICDIRTWDAMQYSYVVAGEAEDNPENMFRYYKSVGCIPDIYIYVDTGADEILSCNNEDFKFNEWLNRYYRLTDEVQMQNYYSAKVYMYNGGFDQNYDYWIDWSSK